MKPPRRCGRCGKPTSGRCKSCLRQFRQRADAKRGSNSDRGYDQEHRTKFRAVVLARDPWCKCGKRRATVADHYPRSRRELVALGLDPNDPQYGRGLCKPCHDTWTSVAQPGHRFGQDH